ncbi:MAG: hypothetical protein V5A88_09940 [Candidatus Thermoplasmatota archaeon]
MATGLLEEELKGLKGKRILIVMDDELGFLGKLIDFDSETLILNDVYQSSAKEINWEEIQMTDVWKRGVKIKEADEEKKTERKDKRGYVEWVEVNLDRVYIRTDHIARIWYESKLEEEDEPPVKSTVYSKE